ncbi:UNVERIFIED_CONTAM: hypothetical protein HDU68_010607 [Siphonaria sp. JEL0065]|nr:hypothetical protein HDU68_010607 [Siphonaria sp. JEL0065]
MNSRKSIATEKVDTIMIPVEQDLAVEEYSTPVFSPTANDLKLTNCSLSSSPSSQNTQNTYVGSPVPNSDPEYNVRTTVESIEPDPEWIFWKAIMRALIALHIVAIIGVLALGFFGRIPKPGQGKLLGAIVGNARSPRVPLKGETKRDHKGFLVAV